MLRTDVTSTRTKAFIPSMLAGTRWTYTASGSVTNLAARLAAVGGDDAIHVGPETRRRLGDGLTVEDVGERRLKNVDDPVRVFRVSERLAQGRHALR